MITAIITPSVFSESTFNVDLPQGLVSLRAWPAEKERPSVLISQDNQTYVSLSAYYRPDYLDRMPQGWDRLEAQQAWERELWRWIKTFFDYSQLKPGHFNQNNRYVSAEKAKVRLPNRQSYIRQFFGD